MQMTVRKAAEREGVLHPVSFRATADLKEKLAKAASEAGRSLTQEIERRVDRSFDHDQMVSSVMETIEENSKLQIRIMELEAELEKLKGAGPDTSDLEAVVERAVARALERVLSPKGQEPEQSQSATELPDRERSVLKLMMVGASNKEIARDLGIPLEAVKAEIKTILKKIQATNRTQAITWAREHLKAA